MQCLKFIFVGIIILLLYFTPVFSRGNGMNNDSIPILFDSEKVLELTFMLNLDSLYRGEYSEKKQYHGKITGLNDAGHLYTIPVIFTKRGHFRKSFNVCDFPPLQVHFKHQHTKETPFYGLKKIKMVTHCQNNDSLYDQYVLQEYLFYKVYNILTDNSFKVRFAKVKYFDISGKEDSLLNYAFFIENREDLALRINGTLLNVHYLEPKAVDQYSCSLMTLFQYMIINQDWSARLLHNVDLFGIYPSLKPITVPFDFDMSWLINIPYNHPTLAYRLGKKPERSFSHEKTDRKAMSLAINKFKLKHEDILNLIHNNKLLNETNKAKILTSFQEFYQLLDNEHWVTRELLRPHKHR